MTASSVPIEFSPPPSPLATRALPKMLEILKSVELEDLERSEDVTFALLPDYRLGYVNPAFEQFAGDNGGTDLTRRYLGRSVLLATPEALRSYYAAAYWKVIRQNTPWDYTFQCPTPTLQRLFRMMLLPLPTGALLVTNALVFEAPRHDGVDANQARILEQYADPEGTVVQCSHCRRLRRIAQKDTWDFVPFAVEHPLTATSHGLCSPCANFLYPTLSEPPPG